MGRIKVNSLVKVSASCTCCVWVTGNWHWYGWGALSSPFLPPSVSPTSHLCDQGSPPPFFIHPSTPFDLFPTFLLRLSHFPSSTLTPSPSPPGLLRSPPRSPCLATAHCSLLTHPPPHPVSSQLGTAGSVKRRTAAARSCTRPNWARRSAAAPAVWAPHGPRRTWMTTHSSSGWFSMGEPPTASPVKVGLFLPDFQALSRGRLTLSFPTTWLGFGSRRALFVGFPFLSLALVSRADSNSACYRL